jgi:predicted transcriptional regulator
MAKLTAKLVEDQLRQLHGNMAAVARAFGVTRPAVYNYIHRHPTLVEVLKECRETMKDHAESALYSAVFDKEAWAVCFYLKTQAKDRGYVEKSELDVTERVRQRVVEEVVDGEDGSNPGPPAPGAARVPPE